MRKNILFLVSLFTLFLAAAGIIFVFYIELYPFDLVQIKKASQLKSSYKVGEELDKKLLICKQTDSPLAITFELSNDDVVLLAMKSSYTGPGCREYVIAQSIPKAIHYDEHALYVTTCYNVFFRSICKTFISDKFMITK